MVAFAQDMTVVQVMGTFGLGELCAGELIATPDWRRKADQIHRTGAGLVVIADPTTRLDRRRAPRLPGSHVPGKAWTTRPRRQGFIVKDADHAVRAETKRQSGLEFAGAGWGEVSERHREPALETYLTYLERLAHAFDKCRLDRESVRIRLGMHLYGGFARTDSHVQQVAQTATE